MTETMQAALIGGLAGVVVSGLFALITTFLNNRSAENRRKAEDRRWYAEYFLGRKIDALSEVYSSMILMLFGTSTFTTGLEILQEDFDQFFSLASHYADTLGLGLVYLEPADMVTLRDLGERVSKLLGIASEALEQNARIAVIRTDDDLQDHMPEGFVVLDFREAMSLANDSREVLERILSPDVLKGIEPEE